MSGLWKLPFRILMNGAETLALLPFYAMVLLSLAIAGCFMVAADWNELFAPPPVQSAAKIETQVPAAKADTVRLPVEQKMEDEVPAQAPTAQLEGTFTIVDPLVGPDGSIRNGEDGPPFFLAEIKPFNSKDVCTRTSGEHWACGLHAYATLRNSVAHKTIQCTNDGSPEEPRVSCQLDGKNLALILIDRGLVELKDDVIQQDLLLAQAKARTARAGIWDR